MSETFGYDDGRFDGEREQRRRLEQEGVERVPFLAAARCIALAPGTRGDEPVYVWIHWAPGWVEQPLPGSALWHAAIVRYLDAPPTRDPTDPPLRRIAGESLVRFPTLDSFARWTVEDRHLERRPLSPPRRRSSEETRWPGTVWPW